MDPFFSGEKEMKEVCQSMVGEVTKPRQEYIEWF